MQAIKADVVDFDFVPKIEEALKVTQPLKALIHSVEADKPMLSQCLPMWHCLFIHVLAWTASTAVLYGIDSVNIQQ